MKVRGPLKTCSSFHSKVNGREQSSPDLIYHPHPKGQAPTSFPYGWMKIWGSPGYPHYDWIGWTIGGRVHWKSFARKVAHPHSGANYVVASSLSWSKLMCNAELGITRIRGPRGLLPHVIQR